MNSKNFKQVPATPEQIAEKLQELINIHNNKGEWKSFSAPDEGAVKLKYRVDKYPRIHLYVYPNGNRYLMDFREGDWETTYWYEPDENGNNKFWTNVVLKDDFDINDLVLNWIPAVETEPEKVPADELPF